MTLLLVFRATDGLLLVADGRRTRTPPGTLDSVPMDDTARKSAITPAGNAVAMAAGSTRIANNQYAADLFEDAMRAEPDADAPTVESVARACFDVLQPWNAQFLDEERAAWVVVAGYDPGATGPTIYRFTLPDTTGGPQLTDAVMREGLLCIPQCRNEDVAYLVREKFGHIPPDKFDELIHLDVDDPRLLEAQEGYTLENQPLEAVAAEVTRVLPDLLDTHKETFTADGVGGTWTVYKLRPGRPAEPDKFKWGPHGLKD